MKINSMQELCLNVQIVINKASKIFTNSFIYLMEMHILCINSTYATFLTIQCTFRITP